MERVRKLFKRLVCRVKGHEYTTQLFTGNTLYFCTRCREEMFNRTFADLEPMTAEEMDRDFLFDQLFEYGEGEA